MTKKTYYKVVMVDADGSLVSCSPPSNHLCLRYMIGHRTVPEVGGVLAYDDLWAAVRAVEEYCLGFQVSVSRRQFRVLRGVGEGTELPPVKIEWPMTVAAGLGFRHASREEAVERVRELWDGHTYRYRFGWPVGTVALEWFQPEEVVA